MMTNVVVPSPVVSGASSPHGLVRDEYHAAPIVCGAHLVDVARIKRGSISVGAEAVDDTNDKSAVDITERAGEGKRLLTCCWVHALATPTRVSVTPATTSTWTPATAISDSALRITFSLSLNVVCSIPSTTTFQP